MTTPRYLVQLVKSVGAYIRDVRRAFCLADDMTSFAQYAFDRLFVMFIGKAPIVGEDKERVVRFKDDILIRYRLNRGDLQSIREVWLDQAYRLPTQDRRRVLIDLGANIGLTSLWLARRYGCEMIIAVEPVESNASLVRANLRANGISGVVIQAVVGATDGHARFQKTKASNQGHIAADGEEVEMISMASLLRLIGHNPIVDVLKIDIEGAETQLLCTGDTSWIQQVREIVIEMHPPIVDRPKLIRALEDAGFQYLQPDPVHLRPMDYFKRV